MSRGADILQTYRVVFASESVSAVETLGYDGQEELFCSCGKKPNLLANTLEKILGGRPSQLSPTCGRALCVGKMNIYRRYNSPT